MDTPEMLRTLEQTPIWLRAGLSRISDARARAAPRAGAWSLADILAHLRASDAILAPRVFQVLIRDQPPLIGFDERAWAALAARAQLPLNTQLDVFAIGRAELVAVLRAVDGDAWTRHGVHETRGALTLHHIVSDLAAHEREHRAQWDDALLALDGVASPDVSPSAPSRKPPRSGPRRTH